MVERVESGSREAARRTIFIAGPTASGKSALSLAIAQRLPITVINTDSMQVYAEMRILTARPTDEEMARHPHRLYGHVSAAENYSVGHWLRDVEQLLGAIYAEGRIPLFVGGTGLYFNSMVQGLPSIPDVDEDLKRHWHARMEKEGADALHRELHRCDPLLAERINPNDRQRVLRGLEVFSATNRPLSEWQKDPRHPILDARNTLRYFLDPDRDWLYERINNRFDEMFLEGAFEEVKALAKLGLDPKLPAMRAHGVPHLIKAAQDPTYLPDAIKASKADVRHYAKRQKTWFRNQMEGYTALQQDAPDVHADTISKAFQHGFASN